MQPILLRASEESKNQRLDAFLASSLDGLTRSQATRLIESGEVAVNGRAVGKSYKLAGGEDIAVTLPEPEPVEAVPQDIPTGSYRLVVRRGRASQVLGILKFRRSLDIEIPDTVQENLRTVQQAIDFVKAAVAK